MKSKKALKWITGECGEAKRLKKKNDDGCGNTHEKRVEVSIYLGMKEGREHPVPRMSPQECLGTLYFFLSVCRV